jgi:hypothetical protein
MAIVINGSGTLSGLAVGGLPDGTVDSGTLATDSVTAAKLEVSAITGADLPAGSVLQVVNMLTESLFSTTATSMQDTPLTLAITPSSTSSKILIVVNILGCTAPFTASGLTFTLQRGNTSIVTDMTNFLYGESSAMNANYTIIKYDSPSSTSAVTYMLQARNREGNTVKFNAHETEPSTMTLMEIAG